MAADQAQHRVEEVAVHLEERAGVDVIAGDREVAVGDEVAVDFPEFESVVGCGYLRLRARCDVLRVARPLTRP